jgi:hypothetical protein
VIDDWEQREQGSRGAEGQGKQRRNNPFIQNRENPKSGESFHPKSKILSSGESKIQNRLTGD